MRREAKYTRYISSIFGEALSCEHKSLATIENHAVKLSALRRNERRLFQTVEAQRENRRAAMFFDEDCVDSRCDVDNLRTRATVYMARKR